MARGWRLGGKFTAKNLAWVSWMLVAIASYFVASYLFAVAVILLRFQGYFSTTVGQLAAHVVLLVAILLCMAGGHYLLERRRLTVQEAGISRQITWRDIALGLAGLVLYALLSALALTIARAIPGFDSTEVQNVGVTTLFGSERLVGFIVLVVVTPFLEELLFRGVLFSKLRSHGLSLWPAAIVVSALFALAHGQWNVAVDVFCLSMVASYLRESTGAIWAGALIHIIKNMVAFYFMFVVMQGLGR